MYVAVKGGERAIEAAHDWLGRARRGAPEVPELGVAQIREQLALAVNRVMGEGSLYDPDLAALAIKQARGDLIEAVFLIRAYRTTLPRFGASRPVDTGAMACVRRISATFKDAPGGQVLGPTFDYTHRLIDFALAAEGAAPAPAPAPAEAPAAPMPHITGFLNRDGLIEAETPTDAIPPDLTREPVEFPAPRALRLQALARADEGFTLGMAYSTQRGYGLVFGQAERKAISMSLVDRAMRWRELGEEDTGAPAQDQEFVVMHGDNIQATGFLEHIKLPHYVDFQAELELIRRLRAEAEANAAAALREAAE